MSRHSQSLANWQALSDQLPESCLRIASYNVHGCRGTDGRKDAARIAQVIREMECDTVGLQEVDYRLDYIAGRVGMEAVPGLTLVRHDGPYGNALLTTRPVLDVRRIELGYGRREPRNALDVDLDVCGTKLRVIVTHLGLFAPDRVWVRPRPALLALKAHRSPLASVASDHLPVKAIVATQHLRWDPYALSKEADATEGKIPIYAARR